MILGSFTDFMFSIGKISQKRVWNSISEVLCSHEHNVTGPQCQNKFNGMKRTFKSIKDHNAKSGNNPRSWPYTEVMESLLGEKPFMNPVALASSSNQARIENENSDTSSFDSDTSVSSSNSRKRKISQVAEVIMKSQRMAEENKLKRHQEIIDQRTETLKTLNKLIDKLQVCNIFLIKLLTFSSFIFRLILILFLLIVRWRYILWNRNL